MHVENILLFCLTFRIHVCWKVFFARWFEKTFLQSNYATNLFLYHFCSFSVNIFVVYGTTNPIILSQQSGHGFPSSLFSSAVVWCCIVASNILRALLNFIPQSFCARTSKYSVGYRAHLILIPQNHFMLFNRVNIMFWLTV